MHNCLKKFPPIYGANKLYIYVYYVYIHMQFHSNNLLYLFKLGYILTDKNQIFPVLGSISETHLLNGLKLIYLFSNLFPIFYVFDGS